MSSKIVRSLSDENPDLHKQIGCMNTIFHHFLSGRRQPHNRLSSGQNGNSTKDSKNTSKNNTDIKTVKEKQRISAESSRTSFSSSSCSSSLSFIESNRASQLETCSVSQTSEVQIREPTIDQPIASSRLSHPSPDLRDVVKDSIYREARGLLVKTVSRGEKGSQALKYFDSPRPMQQQQARKSSERTNILPRRYSCDGRDSRDTSKSAVKLKELPRLSLDSRAGSIRGSNNERKSDNLLGSNQQEEPESRTRLSNVVAKLMGLELLPDATSAVENQTRQNNSSSENKQTRVPNPSSPKMRNDSIKKSLPSSKFPIETAPWRQQAQPDGTTKGRLGLAQPKSLNATLSVYGEIEKRLAQLEFKKSGKDLRALKQILEAMHKTKQMLETRNEDENLETQKSNLTSGLTKSTHSPKSGSKSPIVIMKPGKLGQNLDSRESSPRANDLKGRQSGLPSRLMDKNSAARLTRLSQNTKGPNSNARESTNSGMPRRLSSKQPTESGSPRRKPRPRPRPTSLQLTDDELSDIGSDARDSMSLQSESTSLASQYEEEVSSIDRSNKTNSNVQQSYQRQKPVGRLVKDRSIAEHTIPSSEQPSPVSVLDATFYADELPSPIKKKSIAFKDDNEWNPADANRLHISGDYSLNSVINHKKAETVRFIIQNFIKMLEESSLSKYSSTNPEHQYITEILLASGFLNDFESGIQIRQTGYPISPDVYLALEQVKASAMFSSDKETRTKASQLKLQSKRRKLVFDVVNELLVDKLLPESPYKQCCTPNTLANRGQRGQKLLGELCSEVDRLQGKASNFDLGDEDDTLIGILEEDLRHQSTQWTACNSEIPGLVLDIERLIFKDLITEVVSAI